MRGSAPNPAGENDSPRIHKSPVSYTHLDVYKRQHLAFGPVLRALEDHMLKHMADARMARLFIGRARAHIQADADQGETRVLENIDGEPVGQPGQHLDVYKRQR